MSLLGAERTIWKTLQDNGINVYRMGTERGTTWVEVWLDGHVYRFEAEWTTESVAASIAASLLEQIEARRTLDARPVPVTTPHRS